MGPCSTVLLQDGACVVIDTMFTYNTNDYSLLLFPCVACNSFEHEKSKQSLFHNRTNINWYKLINTRLI